MKQRKDWFAFLCKFGVHSFHTSRMVEPWGNLSIKVSKESMCRRCGKHFTHTEILNIKSLNSR